MIGREYGSFVSQDRMLWEYIKTQRSSLHDYLRKLYVGKVIDAMEAIPRHLFVHEEQLRQSYWDFPVVIPGTDGKASISQPSTIAYMTELLEVEEADSILEVGAGTGYQAAVLSFLAPKGQVLSLDVNHELIKKATERLILLNRENVEILYADGSEPISRRGIFDKIIVTASTPPWENMPILDQLKDGGICVMPVGGIDGDPGNCSLIKFKRENGKVEIKKMQAGYGFVLLQGKSGWETLFSQAAELSFASFCNTFLRKE